MQKKTLLYIFAAAAFLGLVLGAGFFANEVRLKIIQGPDENQFSLEDGQEIKSLNPKYTNQAVPPKNTSVPPLPTGQPKENLPAPAANPEVDTSPELKKEDNKNDSFSFAVIGDTQRFDPNKADGNLQKAVKNITSKNVDVVMAEGDLLSSCDGKSNCEKGLSDWKNILGSLYPKTYEIMGNHDRAGADKSDVLWQKFFELPQNSPEGYQELAYSFDFGNSHFVVLNSEKPSEHTVDKNQRDWLEKDLKDNKKDNSFVFFHEPSYPVSNKIGSSLDVKPEDRDALWEILKKYKVTGVFNGHENIASRKKVDDIYQFVFGNTDAYDHELPKAGEADYSYQGKNYGIVEVKGKEVTVNVYSTDGSLQDAFKIPN